MRHLELARLARDGARERPFLVPEELRFEQRLGNRRAIDGDEWAVGPRTERVQRSREQLLAGTALALEEDGRIRRGRTLQRGKHLPQGSIFADELRRAATNRQLLAQQQVFRRRCAAAPARVSRAAGDDRGRRVWRESRGLPPSSPRPRPRCCRRQSSRSPGYRRRSPWSRAARRSRHHREAVSRRGRAPAAPVEECGRPPAGRAPRARHGPAAPGRAAAWSAASPYLRR